MCSLYPWVNKYKRFPIGHPLIITENFDLIDKNNHPYEGLIKCLVLPPRALYHPVLPMRSGGKLLFPLCGMCAHARLDEDCACIDNDRQFWGTWTTVEVYKALDLGYRVIDVAEVYHYQASF